MSATEPIVDLTGAVEQPLTAEGRLRDALALLRANRVALLGLFLSILFVLIGLAGAVILLTPGLHHLWELQTLSQALKPPSHSHLLGTDQYGRDLLWRAIGGVGIAFMIGVGVTIVVLVVGLTLGSIAGYFGRKADLGITGLIDLTWGFPLLLVAVIVAGMIGKGLKDVVIAVAVIMWAGFARIVRAQVKTLAEREFVEAARMLGVPEWRILLRHMVPNVIGSVLVMGSYYVAYTVIAEAGFSFINLGAQPPTPSLGAMVADGRNYWSVSVWPSVVPGTAIALIVLGLNSLGDGLRDIFDPRLRRF
jgi:ABC-type dipeptide/oligopeptide/nickel transport system permease subunit